MEEENYIYSNVLLQCHESLVPDENALPEPDKRRV